LRAGFEDYDYSRPAQRGDGVFFLGGLILEVSIFLGVVGVGCKCGFFGGEGGTCALSWFKGCAFRGWSE